MDDALALLLPRVDDRPFARVGENGVGRLLGVRGRSQREVRQKQPNLPPCRIVSRRLLSHKRAVGDLVESSLRLLIDVGGEADATALGRWRVHELSDRRENGGDGLIVGGEFFVEPSFEFIETPGEILVRGE